MAPMPSKGDALLAVEQLIQEGNELCSKIGNPDECVVMDELEKFDRMDDFGHPSRPTGFMNRVRYVLANIEDRIAGASLRRIAAIHFQPKADSFVKDRSGRLVLKDQIVKEYQVRLGLVTKELKRVRTALLQGTRRRRKAQSVGRPTDEKIDQAYDLLNEKMKDPEIMQSHPERIKRRRYIVESILAPQFPGYTVKTLMQGIWDRDRKKAARRVKKERNHQPITRPR